MTNVNSFHLTVSEKIDQDQGWTTDRASGASAQEPLIARDLRGQQTWGAQMLKDSLWQRYTESSPVNTLPALKCMNTAQYSE